MSRKSIHLISFVLVLATSGMAQAGLNAPPLLNESFEEETSWGQPTPGWYDYDAGREQYYAFQEGEGGTIPETPYGSVWGALRPDGIHWQKIGTWDAGATYQIDVLVGNRTTWTNGGIYISLWGAGNEALASDDTYPEAIGATKLSESDILITDEVGGVMETKEVSTILSTGTGLTPGDALWIQIINANRQGISYFDYPRIKLIKKASDADDPNPAHGATDIPRNVVISWKPGMYADKHDVYLGTNFDDVNDASRANPLSVLENQNQDPNIYAPPERLAFGETYYWRIDEVNAAPDYTVFKGRVWQFTVEPIAYAIPAERIIAAASSSMSDSSGPQRTVDGSGLNDSDLHSTSLDDMWLSDLSGPQPTWIEYQFDKVYKLHEMWVWNQNQVIENSIGYGFKDVSIEYSVDGISYTPLGTGTEFAQAPGTPGYARNTTVDFGGAVAKYVRLTANSNWRGYVPQYGLSEVRFFHVLVRAREPDPDSGATDVDVDMTLSFRAGREAAKHDVHFSADEQAVIDGTFPVATVTEARYAPSVDLASTYYWRVDEVNDAEIPTTWQSDIWSFSTQEFLVVDDFESYNDFAADEEGSNLVYEAWLDGFGTTTNGSTIGYTEAFQPSMESDTVHGGDQSVPLTYNNTTAVFSEVTRTLAPQNWTDHGVQTLSLWFYGDSTNAPGQLYVRINGAKVLYDGPASNLAQAGWRPWNIDLTSVSTNLESVTSLAIGVEGSGATGTLLLDDIRLYPYPRELVTPVPPDPAGLVGHWKFDEGSGTTAQDSSGNGHAGTLNGDPQWVAGYLDGALEFDGLDDTVNFATGPALGGTTDFSVAAWIKTSATANGVVIQQRNGGYNGQYRLRVNGTGVLNFMVYRGGYQLNMPTTRTVNDGNWHHVMAVRQDARGYIYIDGNLEASGSGTFVARLDASIEVAVGADIRDSVDYFDGTIDDVRIYERPLSYAEVAGLAGRTQPFDKPF